MKSLTLLLIPLILLSSCTMNDPQWIHQTSTKSENSLTIQDAVSSNMLRSLEEYVGKVLKQEWWVLLRNVHKFTRYTDKWKIYELYWWVVEPKYCKPEQLDCVAKQFIIITEENKPVFYDESISERYTCNNIRSIIPEKITDQIIASYCHPRNQASLIKIIKDFWSGFTLSQTNDETRLSYSGKIIKIWSHIPPEKVPFIWDEACSIVWKWFEKLLPSEQSKGKQWVWDALTGEEKKACIKENYGKYIRVEPSSVHERFYIIINVWYEWIINELFDTISWNTYTWIEWSNKWIFFTDDYIFILTYWNIEKNEYSDNLYIFDKNFHFLKKWNNNNIFTKINAIKEITTLSIKVEITEIKDWTHEEINKIFIIDL